MRREDVFSVRELRLSHPQAPHHELPLRRGVPISVGKKDIVASPGMGRRGSQKQPELFPRGQYVFVSIPGDEWGNKVRVLVRGALKDIESRSGGRGVSALTTVTFREVSEKREGKYVDNLIEAIRDSTYAVCDVTGGIRVKPILS